MIRYTAGIMILLLCAALCRAQQQTTWGDMGDGTYRNPVLNADYSDPDVIRVGDKYYMVASDFHFIGMQVLESKDLVNWRIISQIYDRFDMPGWDANKRYAGGSWAPSIRYHDGLFYVFFCTPHEGLFMSTATDARGPWAPLHCVKEVEKWEDPCPIWDEDGQAYLGHSVHGAGPIIVHRMSADGKTLLDEGTTVYTGPVAEGTKWLKRDGYYYLSIPEGGVRTGWQTMLRSRDIYGPYERRIVLEQGSTAINGPHQGALVDTPNGDWWFIHFQSVPSTGRVTHLQPARWRDGWIEIGEDYDGNGIGEPVTAYSKPAPKSDMRPEIPAMSDEFAGNGLFWRGRKQTALGLQWQWCHNPVDSAWSLTEREGWLTLHAMKADSLRFCRNMLTQKSIGQPGEVTTAVDCTNISTDTYAGLLLIGKEFRAVGVCRDGIFTEANGKRQIVDRNVKSSKGKPRVVYLRATIDNQRNINRFYYSTDGKRFVPAGASFTMRDGYWKGVRPGLFCYNTKENGGTARFDYFHYDLKQPAATQRTTKK